MDLHRLPVLRARRRRAGSAPGSATATRSIRSSTAATCCSPSAPRWTGCSTPVVDRTRSRLDVPILRTLFGAKQRPDRNRTRDLSPRLAAVIETPRYDLTLFKVHFGQLDVEGLHQRRTRAALRGDRAQHPSAALRPGAGQVPDDHRPARRHGRPVHHHAGLRRHRASSPDGICSTGSRTPAQIGATRVGGVDLNKPRIRAALAAVLALAAAPDGFTVAEFTAKVHAMTGHTGYTIRQAAYDLRKLRGKDLDRQTRPDPPLPPRTADAARHHRRPARPCASRSSHPILAGVRSPRHGTQTHHLDHRRPRLRDHPHRHANPLPTTSASAPPDRQHLVDQDFVSA